MKLRRKVVNTNKMWIVNVTVKVNDGREMEAEIEIDSKAIYIHYVDPIAVDGYCAIVDCVVLDNDEQIDLVTLMVRGELIIQFRFGSEESKSQFLESTFHDREEDSENSSKSATPSPPPIE